MPRWSTGPSGPGTAVPWLTGWPVTREAALVVRAGEPGVMWVCYDNHVPNARAMARGWRCAPGAGRRWPRRWSGSGAGRDAVRRLGVIGAVPARAGAALAAAAGDVVFLDGEYARLRLVKSGEEIEWLRRGAAMSDDAVRALAGAARPGMTEAECCAVLESGYIAAGGLTHIHYLGVTPMADPGCACPPSGRRPASWLPGTR